MDQARRNYCQLLLIEGRQNGTISPHDIGTTDTWLGKHGNGDRKKSESDYSSSNVGYSAERLGRTMNMACAPI